MQKKIVDALNASGVPSYILAGDFPEFDHSLHTPIGTRMGPDKKAVFFHLRTDGDVVAAFRFHDRFTGDTWFQAYRYGKDTATKTEYGYKSYNLKDAKFYASRE